MFIYKITVKNKTYFGLDTKPEYKQFRWKDHCKEAFQKNSERKVHKAMREAGIENCEYEVVERDFTEVSKLALAEIGYIKDNDTYKNGLNSSLGGDGLSAGSWAELSNEDVDAIKTALGEHWREYNKKKWANTTPEDRKEMTKHLHTQEIYDERAETLKRFYEANPDVKSKKADGIVAWQKKNKKKLKANNTKNGLLGAEKVSITILVENPDGNVLKYKSKSEFRRQTGLWEQVIIKKTKLGESHNGYKAWEIKDEQED